MRRMRVEVRVRCRGAIRVCDVNVCEALCEDRFVFRLSLFTSPHVDTLWANQPWPMKVARV